MRNSLFVIPIKVQCKLKPYCWIFEGEIKITMLIKLLAIVTKISLLLCSTMPSLRFSEKQSPRQCLECYQLFWAVQSREWGWWGTRVRDVILCNAMYCHTSCVLKTGSCAKTDCVTLHCLSVWASLETMQKGTKPWCSARKRNTEELSFPAPSNFISHWWNFMPQEVNSLYSCLPVAAQESGHHVTQYIIFPRSKSGGALLACGWDARREREREEGVEGIWEGA